MEMTGTSDEGVDSHEDENEDSDEDDESEDEDDESEDGSEDEEIDDEEALALRNKIEQALRVNGIEPATGDTDSEDEELMNDEQMMAIDEELAEVFRSRTNGRKSGKSVSQALDLLQ